MGEFLAAGSLEAASLVHFSVGARRMILPDTSVDLAWIDGRVDVIGPMTVGRPTRYPVGSRVVLLTLDPSVAAASLDLPLELLADRVVDLRDINTPLAAHLAEQFARGTVRGLVATEREKLGRASSRENVAIAHLSRGVRVAAAADAVNLGERQFTRWFRHRIGMHPKRFQRVARVRRAIAAAKGGTPLAAAAAECGFADQAHFSRDVRMLVGEALRSILPNVGNVQDIGQPLG